MSPHFCEPSKTGQEHLELQHAITVMGPNQGHHAHKAHVIGLAMFPDMVQALRASLRIDKIYSDSRASVQKRPGSLQEDPGKYFTIMFTSLVKTVPRALWHIVTRRNVVDGLHEAALLQYRR